MGAGKSSVIAILREAGVPVWDCDSINRALLQKNAAGYQALRLRYGDRFLDENGALATQKLSDYMFTQAGARQEVEALLHPLIRREVQACLQGCRAPVAVVEVPLLFESGWQSDFDETWVVACDEDLLLKRLLQRGVSRQEAKRRLASQLSQQEKIALSDVVLYNNLDKEALKRQVLACLEKAQVKRG